MLLYWSSMDQIYTFLNQKLFAEYYIYIHILYGNNHSGVSYV
jgi:hypothetical protein